MLVEGVSPNFHDVVGADFRDGRPLTETESRVQRQVAVLGASVARALFGNAAAAGRSFLLGGDRYYVVGELAPRKGTFFGENRNDSVVAIPVTTARRKFPDARNLVLYVRAKPGLREQAREEARAIFRLVRSVPAGRRRQLRDELRGSDHRAVRSHRRCRSSSPRSRWPPVSLAIGGIGIANVMVISVTERTREIGVRLAIGARRQDVRRQFLIEAAILSGAGGGYWRRHCDTDWRGAGVRRAGVSGRAAVVGRGRRPADLDRRRHRGRLSAGPACRGLDPVEALRYE